MSLDLPSIIYVQIHTADIISVTAYLDNLEIISLLPPCPGYLYVTGHEQTL
jgi:hypothetical protein